MKNFLLPYLTKEREEYVAGLLFALAFTLPYIANFLSLYIGWSYAGSREEVLLTRGILFCWAGVALCLGGYLYKFKQLTAKQEKMFFLVVLLFAISYIAWYLIGDGENILKRYVIRFCGLMIPSLIVGMFAGRFKGEKHFFGVLECISLFFLPVAIVYISGLFGFNSALSYKDNNHRNIGQFDYMYLAYCFMPFLLAHIIDFSKGKVFSVNTSNIYFTCCEQLLRYAAVLIYLIAVILCATRGVYVCIGVSVIALLGMSFFYKKNILKTMIIVVSVLGILFFGLFAKGSPMAYRMGFVIENLMHGRLITSKSDTVKEADIQELIDKGKVKATKMIISNRGTLYKLAIGEFVKSPIWGMGPGGFIKKYGLYPHNAFLEILCELGSIGVVIFGWIAAPVFRNVLKLVFADKNGGLIVVFFFPYIIFAMISGSVWTNYFVMVCLGYGITVVNDE